MDKAVELIHNSPIRTSLIVTGAGATSISALTDVAGCSRTLIDAQVPYFTGCRAEIINEFPARYLSPQVGTELAHHAFHKAKRVFEHDQATGINNFGVSSNNEGASNTASPYFVGIGCTAAVRTDRSRRGEDGAYITAWHERSVDNYRLILDKGMSRAEQEQRIGALIIFALTQCDERVAAAISEEDFCESIGIAELRRIPATPTQLQEAELQAFPDPLGENVAYCQSVPHPGDPFVLLMTNQVDKVVFNNHGIARHRCAPYSEENIDVKQAHYLLLPGSFAPLHWGHTELARVASEVVQRKAIKKQQQQQETQQGGATNSTTAIIKKLPVVVTYEISSSIVDKRELHETDLNLRVGQFLESGNRVALTRAKLFVEKARMFPNHGFVLGIDTAERVLDPKFYNNSRDELCAALAEIRRHGCYFVVGGRIKANDASAAWSDVASLDIPSEFQDMFIGLRHEDFRVDISSTEIRARRGDVKEMKLYVDVERIYNELREMGVGPSDPLTVEQLLPYDQYHYFGTDTVREGAERSGITAGKKVLDLGSGLGGPARFLAKTFGCNVLAVELQSDLSRVAEELTRRCSMDKLITHRTADFLAADPKTEQSDAAAYDCIVSWLVFVHIPDRKKLLQKCFAALKPGGRLFVEDFHRVGGASFTKEEEAMLAHDVHCSYLPTLADFKQQCEDAGFVSVDVGDYTKEARVFARQRYDGYQSNIRRHIRVHGEATAAGMCHFYRVIADLFDGGRFGLCRVLAQKP